MIDPAAEPSAAGVKLGWWREEIHRLIRSAPVHPITRYLVSLPRAMLADFSPLIASLEAAARQLAGAPLERGAELEPHGAALYANPLLVARSLAGEPAGIGMAWRRSASALGAAQYLAHAIADYRREALRGRVIFPVDELLDAGIDDADLSAATPPMRLKSYLEEQRRRAAGYFETAAAELPPAERDASRHILVLAALGAKHARAPHDHGGGFRPADLYLAWSTARRAARPAAVQRRP